MSGVVTTTHPTPSSRRNEASGPRLSGAKLWAARVVWLILVAANIASFIDELPPYVAGLSHACVDGCVFSPTQVHALNTVGVSIQTYAWASVAISIFSMLVAVAIALALFWRRSDEWIVLIVAYLLTILPCHHHRQCERHCIAI